MDNDQQGNVPNSDPLAAEEDQELELHRKMPALICSLIREVKTGLVCWLACYVEQENMDSPMPFWLIKALELADIVQGENGPGARFLAGAAF